MATATPLTCVLFDLDGTLVDTTNLIFESYRHTTRTVLGYTPTDAQLLDQYGRPLVDTFRAFIAALERRGGSPIEAATETDRPAADLRASAGDSAPAEALLARLVAVYREYNLRLHDALIRSFPGVEETVPELRRRGYMLGVVTSKGRHTTTLSLARYDLAPCMRTVVTLEDTTMHKPNPEPVLKALANLGLPPQVALFVGDSVHDLAAGRAAGVRTGAALWGPFPRADLAAIQPDYLLESISDLLTLCPPLGERN
ncbi:MAG: HAD-IA family hydrolase [Chloroflexota bacterium]